jgi:hypothetical protein
LLPLPVEEVEDVDDDELEESFAGDEDVESLADDESPLFAGVDESPLLDEPFAPARLSVR